MIRISTKRTSARHIDDDLPTPLRWDATDPRRLHTAAAITTHKLLFALLSKIWTYIHFHYSTTILPLIASRLDLPATVNILEE